MRFLKFIVGLLLLPVCVAVTRSVVALIVSIQPLSIRAISSSTWSLIGGFALWIFVYFSMSRPFRTYVLAHELTHALWGWFMGAKVSRVRVSKRGGSVSLSKTNFLIALAPYFFPLYTVLVMAVYFLSSLFFDLHVYEPFWLGLIGLTWGFHLTFTISTLLQHQPDVRQHGWLFSMAVIYLMNVLGVGIGVVSVASPTWAGFTGLLGKELLISWEFCRTLALQLAAGLWPLLH